jgi:P-type conjugative transfer protein TrbG
MRFAAAHDDGKEQTIPIDRGDSARSLYRDDPTLHAVDDRQGQYLYPYGQALTPTLTCAPLHICVINLMKGEQINDTSMGDTVRWLIRATRAGDRPVVIVKPVEAGLSTSLVVTTDKGRVYYINLVSAKTSYMPQIGFYDPQAMTQHYAELADQKREREAIKADKKNAAVGVDPEQLDFDYTCTWNGSRSGSLLPVRVFSGAGHLYIKMPEDLGTGDAPAVFNTSNGGNELVNFRLVRGYYIIDGVPEKIRLTIGTAQSTRDVSCEHGAPKAKGFFDNFFGEARS